MHLIRRLLLPFALCVLVSACQLRLATDLTLDADGGGNIELIVALDAELAQLLDDAGVDLRRGLPQAAEVAPTWEVEERPVEDGVELRFRSSFDDPDDLQRLVDDLHAGLDAQDGRILRSLDVRVAPSGAVLFQGTAGLLLPETTGAEGAGVDVDGDALRRLLEERGDEFVRYDLRVTLPAEPAESDADVVEGRTLGWRLPVGDVRTVSARSEVPSDRTWMLVAGVAAGAFLVAATSVAWTRRRGRRRARRRAGSGVTPSG